MPRYPYDHYFPFSNIRKEQRKAIEFALDAYESGKKYVILELGTGVGKSATGVTIARYMEAHGDSLKNVDGEPLTGAYVVTTQKILQAQYLRDFGPESGKNLVRSIKSSNNYQCGFYEDQTCAESKRILSKLNKQLSGTEFQKHCKISCPYSIEKQQFIDSPVSVTNFPYILAESTYAGKLEPRALLIVDEAHNTEGELGKFIEVTFSEKFARDIVKCKPPRSDAQSSIYEWVKTTYLKALKKHMSSIEKSLLKLSNDIEGYGIHSKQYEILDKHLSKLDKFIEVYKPENWAMNVVVPSFDNIKAGKKYEFKPIDVSPYSQDTFFKLGGRVLMMSATIVDKDIFCSSLGLKTSEVAYLTIPSPFPLENRPIHYIPAGSMSKNKIESSLPILVEAIKMLLEKHKNEKGIIHCVEENTLVTLGDKSLKKISNVAPGEEILTWNESSHSFEIKFVDDVWTSGIRECIEIELENGQNLICTPEHRILTFNRGWIEAKDLNETDDIVSYSVSFQNDLRELGIL